MILSNNANKVRHIPILENFVGKTTQVYMRHANRWIDSDVLEYDFETFSILFYEDTFYITNGPTHAIDFGTMRIIDNLLATDIIKAFEAK